MKFTIETYDYECTTKCRLVSHGNAITAALTKRSVPDKQLAAFIAKTCRNFANVLDEYGRSALHMAASVGRDELVEWLIDQGANIAQKDTESGHTALHRALYYGRVAAAIRLVKRGAALDTPDKDFVNPLQLCSSGKRMPVCDTEVVVWGKNKYYNLGTSSLVDRDEPRSIELFMQDTVQIKRVAITAYHSVFLPPDSKEVYVVGYGVGGRLGLDGEYTVTRPERLPVPASQNTTVADVSAGKYHTLLLRDDNRIFACGENKHCQLGISPPPEKQLTFRDISERSVLYNITIARVIAKDYHSIAVGIKDVYVWGLNGGQFGLEREAHSEVFVQPKALVLPRKGDATVVLVESSNAAIAVWTLPACLYILYGFKVKTFKNPLMEQIIHVSVAGGDLQTARDDVTRQTGEVRVIVITVSRLICIWYEEQQQFVRCVFSQACNLEVEKMMWCGDSVLVLLLGHLYRGTLTHRVSRSVRSHHSGSMKMFIRRSDVCESLKTRIELQRIPNLTHVREIVCHEGGENYAALIENSRRTLEEPEEKPMRTGFDTLLADASPDDDVHDVVLCVEGHQFAAHRFILYHRSEFLRRLLQASPKRPEFDHKQGAMFIENTRPEFDLMQCGIDGLTVGAFKLALRYIYTNRYVGREDILQLLRKPGEKRDPKPGAVAELCNQLRGVFERLELSRLAEMLERIYSSSSGLLAYDPPEEPFPALPFNSYRELHDLTILLQGQETLRVHRCVLVTRLEYFAVMFGHTWGENRKTADLHTIPHCIMETIVKFLYDHDTFEFELMDQWLLTFMLPACDQLFVEDLKRLLETLLVKKVNLYNAISVLHFACKFNCELVKHACLQLISTNLDRLLEAHLLEHLSPKILEQISTFYREHYNLDSYRTITPFSDAIGDEELDQFVRKFRVQFKKKPLYMKAKKEPPPSAKVSRSQQQKLSLEKEAMDYLQRLSLEEESVANERKNAAAAAASKISKGRAQGAEQDICATGSPLPKPEADGTKSWHKVTTATADAKRKSALSAALRANEVMKAEAQQQHPSGSGESFSNLRTVLEHSSPTSGPRGGSPDEGHETAATAGTTPPGTIVSPISLADFGLQKGKLSQKQRKRLSSITETVVTVATTGATESNGGGAEDQQVPTVSNPWKTITSPSVSSLDAIQSAEAAGGLRPPEASDVARRQRQRQSSNGSGTAGQRLSSGEKDFTEILADERRQKQYHEKQRLKSLTETQLEEQAIEELKAFYNVEQVYDEHITIERYRPPLATTPKVAVWGQRQ